MQMISMLQKGSFLVIIEILCVTVTAQTNLALNGTVDQETTYTDKNGITHSANLAIEGPVNNNWEDGCSSTQPGHPTAWWGLYLPALAFITNILIYFREDGAAQMDDFRLFVLNTSLSGPDEYLCYTDLGIAGLPDTTQDIDCYKLAQKVFFFNRHKVVELCYIEINGCWKGTWGPNCTTDCPVECIDNHCFPQNGSCIWGCDLQKCFHGQCDAKTDVCTTGCVPERGGRYCTFYNTVYNRTAKQSLLTGPSSSANILTDGNTTSCIRIVTTSSNSFIQIGNESLIVISGVYLFFGDTNPPVGIHKVYCSNTTDSWADGIVLYNAEYHNNDTTVFAICKYIMYIPPILKGNSNIDICEIEIGGCPYGKYGDTCQLTCPENCMGTCNLVTGKCLLGCSIGWLGEKCDRACDVGRFGNQCLRDCSANCLSSPCNHMTGKCMTGCKKGWEGFNCTEECSNGHFGWNCSETCDGCIVNECNSINGVCKIDSFCKPGYVYGKYCNEKCKAWQFGTNCNKMCNCLKIPCNIFTGECSNDGCKKGWKGDSCDQECESGYFGYNCAYLCETCFNQSCDIIKGNCRVGCNDGYRGRKCDMPVSTDSSEIIRFGFFVGGLASMCVVLFIIWMVKNARRRILKTKEGRQATDNSHSRSNEQHYDDIMKMEGISTYQDLSKQTVSNEYDQINN